MNVSRNRILFAGIKMKLPVVDLNLCKTAEGRQGLAKIARDALVGSGFIYLEGMEGYDPDMLHELCKWFYDLPMENRMSISKKMFQPSSDYIYRGYFPVQPGNQSHKEAFEMGCFIEGPGKAPYDVCQFFFEDNQWPQDPQNAVPYAETFREHFEVFTKAGFQLLELVAESYGADRNMFTDLFIPSHLSTFRLIHYPCRGDDLPDCVKKDGNILRCDEHQDSGFVTMLETFDYKGLQIRNSDGEWNDVEHRQGSLIVNIGILFSKITGGELKATPHRVIDYGGDRFSVPFFLEPNYNANVHQVVATHKEEGVTKTGLLPTDNRLSYGKWLVNNLIGYIEYESLKNLHIPE